MKEGWEYKKLSGCIEKVPKQKQVKSKDYQSFGKYPIVSQEKNLISGYWDDESFLYKHEKPVIIFGDHTKEIKFIDFNFVVGADGTQILSPQDDLIAKFFYYALLATPIRNLGYARHFKLLKEKYFPIPSISEQERIVEYLDKAFKDIDTLKDNAQKQLDDARKLFQAALTEAMTPKEGWKEATIQEAFDTVTDFVAAGSFADLRKNVIYNSNPDYAQLVRTTDLKHSFNNDSFVYVDEHAFKYLWRVNLNEECIILPNVGVNCGEIYYVTPKSLKYKNNVLGPNAILIRSHVANNLFMSYYMKSVYFQEKIQQITSRMAQPKFNKTNLKTLIVCLPKIVEQKAIVKDLEQLSDIIRKLEEINRKTIAECDALKQSILRQIFE